ncbi:MAG: polyketide synthase dehydratase domain-containing protein [Caldilineae bacterium]|nr:polyketide synthase dehydratase domain-containing protein [Caldilineae bacterium]
MTQANNTEGAAVTGSGQGVAIIGMSCMFPGARDLDAFWQNIVSKVDAVTDPPPEAWDSDIFYDPASNANDRVYCKKGGFLGPLAEFNPLDYGIMPIGLDGGEPDQWLGLKLAYDALADARYLERLRGDETQRRRTAVILGKGTYLNRGNLNMVQHSLVVDQTLQVLQSLHPEYGEEALALVRAELKRKLPPFDAASAPGLVPNIAAGRIANRLDLMGPSYTVDAACASSLIAVEIALRDLQTNHCDLALVGGAQVTTPIPILTLFSQLGALSHQEQIRPFDSAADGTILSEGIGMLVLKREADALRDGDRIYAVIKGVGSSSDGRAMSVLTPRLEGEVLALRLAYENAGIDPTTVGLIEAHGTGTLVGDATEIEALSAIFGEREGEVPHTALGTVKSMIGHTMPAAGVAGIIKTALALHNKVLPPTIHCENPNPKLKLEDSNFYLNSETRPWIQSQKTPRRAGVNAFGFGGVNAHVVLEEAQPQIAADSTSHMNEWDSEVVIIAAADRNELLESVAGLVDYLEGVPDLADPGFSLLDLAWTINQGADGQPCRLAVVATSVVDLRDKLVQAAERLQKPKTRRIKDVRGIYFFEEPFYPQGKLAFLFPGEGSQYPNMLADLAIHFPEVRTAFDRIDRIFAGHPRGYVPSDFIFPAPGLPDDSMVARQLWEIDGAVEAVLTGNAAIHALLLKLGVQPDAMVGHSTGEYSALLASGMIAVNEDEFVGHYLLNLNQMYEKVAQDNNVPRAFMLAVGAGLDKVAPLVEKAGDSVFVGMDNCPHQSVVVGDEAERESLTAAMKAEGLIFESLRFDRAYHTALFQPYSSLFEDFYTQLPLAAPSVTTYSCVTTAPFGDNAEDIRTLAIANWINRVRFRETIQAMYDDGVRIFVEAGARGNLTAFVGDILRGQPHLAIPANIQQRSGITQLNHLVALLYAQGVPLDIAALYERRRPRAVDLTPEQGRHAGRQRKGTMKLASGWAGMEVSAEAASRIRGQLASKTGEAALDRHPNPAPSKPVSVPAPPQQNEEEKKADMQHNPIVNDSQRGVRAPTAPADTDSLMAAPQTTVDGRTLVMQGHLQLMDQFLRTQEALVKQFLTGVPTSVTVPALPSPLPVQSVPVTTPTVPAPSQPAPPATVEAPAAEVEPAVPSWTLPAETQPLDLKDILLNLVSDKTGYPVDVLSLDANLEADLGIDSIKRVEILGAFNQETGLVEGDTMEQVSSLKTLGAILDFFQSTATPLTSTATDWPSTPTPAPTADLLNRMPFLGRGDARTYVPGEELDIVCTLDVAEDLFMRDHTLGREISRLDPELLALPIVPLTVTMEILAETAAVLAPGQVLTGMRNLRAYRWIILQQGAARLHMTAKRRAGADGNEFDVVVRVLPDDDAAPAGPAPAVAEGTMVFAAAYPDPPAVATLALHDERPSQWQPERLYRDGMFHGPSFRAVKSIERIGSNGLVATMEALPTDRFLRSNSTPGFIAEPILLDAAGQLVGFWTLETLEQGFVVFPYHLEALHFYGPPLPAGEQVTCQVHSTLLENLQMTSDIDIVDASGRLRMRLDAWDDKRFDIPRPFYRFILSQGEAQLSEPWTAPLVGYSAAENYRARKIKGFPAGFFQAHYGLWEKTLAHLVLTPAERLVWRGMTGADSRRIDWLLGRVAAKEALATYLHDVYNRHLKAADIEISTDERGSPYVTGDWLPKMAQPIALTIAHTRGVAVAVAGPVRNDGRMPGIGVDLEPVERQDSSFADVAFTREEQSVLADLEESQTDIWPLRVWCAKEAVGKALGYGLAAGPHSVTVERVDIASGFVFMNLAGTLVDLFPNLSGERIAAYTARENGYVLASVLGQGRRAE